MRRITLPLLSLLQLPFAVGGAQTPAWAQQTDQYVKGEVARQHIPGLTVAVLRGDSVVLARGYGYANLEHHVPATDSTVYEVGSVSKQFTAAAVVMLSEQGGLRLDDAIAQFLPEGATVWKGVTIRHLLTHTSGIPDYPDTALDYHRDYSEDDLVRLAARQPPDFSPGETWSYSSTGYVLLGVIIHRVAGVFYGDFLRDHIFHPLAMRTARVNSELDIVPNRAAGYELVAGVLRNQDWVSPSLNTTADAGLSFTVRDLAQWAIALNHGTVPSRAGLEASWTPVRLNDGRTYPYGFGWHVTQLRGYRRIGHSGSWRGFQSTMQRFPDFGLTVIVLTNVDQSGPEAISFGIAGIMEPALTPPHLLSTPLSGAPPRKAIDQLLGDLAAGRDSGEVTPGLKTFMSDAWRERLGRRVKSVRAWTSLGCDDVAGQHVVRLGARIEQICYAKGSRPVASALFTILYDADWRAAGIDLYFF